MSYRPILVSFLFSLALSEEEDKPVTSQAEKIGPNMRQYNIGPYIGQVERIR